MKGTYTITAGDTNSPTSNESSHPENDNHTSDEKSLFRKSKLRCFIILIALFLVTLVIFIVLFAVFYTKYKNEESVAATAVCSTPGCVIAAAMMAKKMNSSADPCQDFSEYASGRFMKETIIPVDTATVSLMMVLADEIRLIMKDIIVEDIKDTQPQYLSNMKRLYRSCIDEDKIETTGLTPYTRDGTFVNDWPTLNPKWDNASFRFNETIVRYAKVYVSPIFSGSVDQDIHNYTKRVIYLDEGKLGMATENFGKPRNDSVIMAYQKYLAETAIELGAYRKTAEDDARDVVDLEIALSKINVPPPTELLDFIKLYNQVQLANLSTMYPQLDIPGVLRAVFATVNITLPDNETVINLFPTYFGNISSIVGKSPHRTLQNLFGFKYALSRVEKLTRRMREIRHNFDKVLTGTTDDSPRWKVCLDSSSGIFVKGMGKQFVNKAFSETTKSYIAEMIVNLKAEFKKMIEEKTWMSQATKSEALSKLAAMHQKIGYPDSNFEDADLDRFYENYNMSEDTYYENLVLSNTLTNLESLLSLRTPGDRNDWSVPLFEVNAFYTSEENGMTFPAAILRPSFFSETFQDFLNYGAIGVVIGHEITHGYDNKGSQFDAEGKFRDWWQPQDREIFLQKVQCIVDQNSNFRIDEINMTVNGNRTLGDSVSDNGGLKVSFRAYKELVRRKGHQPPLPGLNLNQDQLFFLACGQLWCVKQTREQYINVVTNGKHPPGKFRIISPLQNSPEFAKAYNCPLGSYMNPVKKCEVW